MYLIAFPLLLIPFAFFNMVVFLLNMPLTDEEKSVVFQIPLVSEVTMPPVLDRSMPVTISDLIVAIGMLLLYVEVVKAVRPGGKSIWDHVLSFILFVAMAAELMFVPRAMAWPRPRIRWRVSPRSRRYAPGAPPPTQRWPRWPSYAWSSRT